MLYASHHPDLIILDLGLPDRDGLDLIQEVRESDTVPIIVLSARSNERDKVTALDLGANDYITKPFGTEELLTRIRKVLTYAAIIHAVWGYSDYGSVKKLQVNMKNIRKKMGVTPGEKRYIINELGVGYRMLEDDK